MENKNQSERLTDELKKMETKELLKLLVEKMGYDFSKEEIIGKPSEKYQEIKEDLYTGYLQGFDEEFETQTTKRIKETPLLINLFQEFIQEIYQPSELYNIVLETKIKISDELNKTLNKEQKHLVKQMEFCDDKIVDDIIEQAFIYGYAMSCQLREEAVKQYPYKGSKTEDIS